MPYGNEVKTLFEEFAALSDFAIKWICKLLCVWVAPQVHNLHTDPFYFSAGEKL
jgi:hypothetical protein